MNRREFLKGAIRGLVIAIVPVVFGDVGGGEDVDIDFSDGFFTLQEGGFVERSGIAKEWEYDPTTKVATVDYWNLKPSDKDTYKIL